MAILAFRSCASNFELTYVLYKQQEAYRPAVRASIALILHLQAAL